MRGLQRRMPVLAGVFTFVMLASIGVPGLNGFVGEFLILAGTFLTHRWWAVVATGGVVLAAVYLLWAYQQAFHGKPTIEKGAVQDLTWQEGIVLAPLVILIVLLGIFPGPLLNRIGPSVSQVVTHVEAVAHQRPPQVGPRRRPPPGVRSKAMSLFAGLPSVPPGRQLRHPAYQLRRDPPRADPDRGSARVARPGQLVFARCRSRSTRSGSGPSGRPHSSRRWCCGTTCRHGGPSRPIADSVAVDGFAIVFLVLVSCVVIIGSAIANDFLVRGRWKVPSTTCWPCWPAAGAMFMAAANDLILIFVALEIMSIPLYVLAGMDLRRRESGEAAMKYFVLGAFSSAIFVYGIALVYGATGRPTSPRSPPT